MRTRLNANFDSSAHTLSDAIAQQKTLRSPRVRAQSMKLFVFAGSSA
jgi:hypothetical protein